MADYTLALIISFAGIILGSILARIAHEELGHGAKYWKILEWALLAAIIAVVFYFSKPAWALAISALLIFLKIANWEYPALAFVLFLSAFGNFMFIAASLIFIYGLPKGTLDAMRVLKDIKKKKELVIHWKWFLYLAIGFALLPLLIAYP